MAMKRIVLICLLGCGILACEEEEKPQSAPVISGPLVECGPGESGEFDRVVEVSVEVTDVDGDLLSGSVTGFINGLQMDNLADPNADNQFTWTPPVEFSPPLVCNGEFTLVIAAEDAGGRVTRETLRVTGN